VVISGYWWLLVAISGYWWLLVAIDGYQCSVAAQAFGASWGTAGARWSRDGAYSGSPLIILKYQYFSSPGTQRRRKVLRVGAANRKGALIIHMRAQFIVSRSLSRTHDWGGGGVQIRTFPSFLVAVFPIQTSLPSRRGRINNFHEISLNLVLHSQFVLKS